MGDLELFVKVTEAERKKVCHLDISTSIIFIGFILISVTHMTCMMKLKVMETDW